MNLDNKTGQEDTLKEEKRQLMGRIDRHKDTEKELKQRIVDLERLYKKLEDENTEFKSTLEFNEGLLIDRNEQIATLEQKIRSFEDQIRELQDYNAVL